ncbi:MAG: hypothetical protein KDJ16_08740, partial [Hyphomicrobiales bacterium]|nr:hypothetical protein [Hyphomicrobiales bacterium]
MAELARKDIETEDRDGDFDGAPSEMDTERTSALDVSHDVSGLMLPELLRMAVERFGKSYTEVVMDLARLSIGPGRLSPEEYFVFRLFDDEALDGADKREFAGYSAGVNIWAKANPREEFFGLLDDKISFDLMMKGYGMPVLETVAFFHRSLPLPGIPSFNDAQGLRRFFTAEAPYPIFGKPRDELQSLGSISLRSYDPKSDSVATANGGLFRLDDVIADIIENYGGGYIFQRTASPHNAVREICGDRLATVRVMTVNFETGPEIFRACWKIPAGDNVADNFWRPGNILAELDIETGTVKRAFSGI